MAERVLRGVAASPGIAVGAAWVLSGPPSDPAFLVPVEDRRDEGRRALAALEDAAGQLETVVARLRAEGRDAEAEIVDTGALMARDPALASAVEDGCARGLTASAAIVEAAAAHADLIAALPDPTLAARADDVRSLGRRAARLAGDDAGGEAPAGDVVLVAEDLGPADVAELGVEVRGIALAGGGATAHAAIVARSLGLPLVAGLGASVLAVAGGSALVLDGDEGVAVVEPGTDRVASARGVVLTRARARERAAAARSLPAATVDGHRVTVLANVAGPGEVAVALEAGAEGVGLLRTELAFLEATAWPGEAEHRRALEPTLAALAGLPTTVRVLDFGGDKTPPFLNGTRERGIRLLLDHPDALAAQLRAIVAAGGGVALRVLVPMVATAVELLAVRDLLSQAVDEAHAGSYPALGAMIETPRAAAAAYALATRADFLSIGTNDLTAATLGVDRFAAGRAPAHDPRVLALVARSVRAAHDVGIPIEVCGEAASDPVTLPLLVGLGVDELSVGASRVGTVRAWVRALHHDEARLLARGALAAADAGEVEALCAPTARRLALLEGGDAAGEGLQGDGGVVPVGSQA